MTPGADASGGAQDFNEVTADHVVSQRIPPGMGEVKAGWGQIGSAEP